MVAPCQSVLSRAARIRPAVAITDYEHTNSNSCRRDETRALTPSGPEERHSCIDAALVTESRINVAAILDQANHILVKYIIKTFFKLYNCRHISNVIYFNVHDSCQIFTWAFFCAVGQKKGTILYFAFFNFVNVLLLWFWTDELMRVFRHRKWCHRVWHAHIHLNSLFFCKIWWVYSFEKGSVRRYYILGTLFTTYMFPWLLKLQIKSNNCKSTS